MNTGISLGITRQNLETSIAAKIQVKEIKEREWIEREEIKEWSKHYLVPYHCGHIFVFSLTF